MNSFTNIHSLNIVKVDLCADIDKVRTRSLRIAQADYLS